MGNKPKKLVFVLSLVLIFPLCNAQEWTSSGSPDTVFIRMAVRMIGASWTFNEGGEGPSHTAPSLSFALDADTFHAELDSATMPVNPCDVMHHIFWIENTGGVSLDFNVFFDESLSGPDWIHDDAATEDCRGEDTLLGSYSFEPADPSLSTTPSIWTVLPESIGTSDEFEDLYAEDPTETPTIDDGTWEADEQDIVDFHIMYVMPGSSSSLNMQHFFTAVAGKLTD